jgi:hypothetical protein
MSYRNVKYIGINNPSVIVKDMSVKDQYENNGIQMENVSVKMNEADLAITPEQLLAMHSLRRDSFEYLKEYDERINGMEAITCGVVILDRKNYEIERHKFNIDIIWYKSFLNSVKDSLPENGFFMELDRDRAKKLYYNGACQRVYIKLRSINGKLLIEKIFLRVEDEEFQVEYKAKYRSSEQLSFLVVSTGIGGYGIQLI